MKVFLYFLIFLSSNLLAEQAIVEDLWKQARYAYWQGELDKASDLYQTLAKLSPSNPDIIGELGNIYYFQFQWDLAANVYYQAILLLLQQQRKQEASRLLSIVARLDPNKAMTVFPYFVKDLTEDNHDRE